jgi:hypothetical protein
LFFPAITGLLLDVGCDSMLFRNLFSAASTYHGLDIDQARNRRNPNDTHRCNGELIPIAGSAYQLVICS